MLSFNFSMYAISGVWRPVAWSSGYARLLYNAFTVLVMYLLNFSVMTQLLDIILVVDNVNDFTTTSLMLLSAITAFSKASTIVIRRSQIINLIDTLLKEPHKARDEEEIAIQAEYDRFIRSCSISYAVLATFSATGATVGEIFAVLHGQLPYRGWIPYDYSCSLPLFLLTALQEMLALIFGTFVNIGTETLMFGLCLQTCAQLKILTHRLQRIARSSEKERTHESSPNKRTSRLSGHIYHHLCIIRFAKMVNETFNQVLFAQFFASILILCSTVYYLSSHLTIADLMSLTIYAFCMFVQIYVYCWAGNEVMLKSTGLSDAVYHTDWILLTNGERKDLLMIMRRSARPIKFTSSFLVTLSLDSYVNILKMSYSAFNILQQS